jgi:hypothetical protein
MPRSAAKTNSGTKLFCIPSIFPLAKRKIICHIHIIGTEAGMRNFNTLSEILEVIAKSGTLYVRWSRGPEFDMVPGAVSKDYQSGETHNGLSAIEVDADMSAEQLFRYVRDYSFLRAKDKEIRPHVYAAKRIGADSDNAPTIRPVEHVGSVSDALVEFLDDESNRERIQLMEQIATNKRALEIYKITPPAYIPAWTEETLRNSEVKLAALGGTLDY